MTARERFERLARAAASRPFLTLGVVLALAIGGGLLALGLRPDASSSTFVSSSSSSFRATDDDHKHFGADAVVVLVREKLTNLVETKDLATLSQLEACLGGQVLNANQTLASFTPAAPGSKPPYGGYNSPCGKLMKARPVQVVYGPGTFLNRAVAAVNTQITTLLNQAKQAVSQAETSAYKLAIGRHMSTAQAQKVANAAGTLKQQQEVESLEQLYLNSGISGTPSIDDPQFIPQIVFDQTRGVNQPKARFSYLFPTANSALIQVRLKAGLSDAQQRAAINWIREAVQMPQFRLSFGGTYTVSGVPVVTNDLASEITGSIAGLLVAAVLVMAAMLLIVFRSRLRLLPLAVALAAVGITFGVTSLLGATLTMASIAVLPILIGLAVDYAIQFQSRVQEFRRSSTATRTGVADAVARAAGEGAPTIATAALATATGFLVLLLSPVPMVRGFGVLLVVGIAIALAVALTAGSAALVLTDRNGGLLGASMRGAAEILRGAGAKLASLRPRRRASSRRTDNALSSSRSAAGRILAGSVRRPQRVLAAGLVLAAVGWVADTRTSVQTDVTKLVPSKMPALRDLHTLENVTGVSGEIDVTVHARNVATPSVIGWMIRYENALLTHFGYLEAKGCGKATLCPALSLPDLFSTGSQGTTQAPPSAEDIDTLLKAVPGYFSQAVITPDHREAALAFGIRLMPLSRQERVIDYMRSQLHPPPGVSAQLAGIPVLAAEANAALSSSARRLLTLLAGLVAVGLVLLAVFRRSRRVIVPLIPIALATGWSALTLFLIGIPLNPMSATLGTLVIAISTEFSVLLSERFRQERQAGYELSEALARTYRSTGRAVLASGLTAIAGFGVLIFSNITMLRDFGFVTLIDLSVSLAGVLLLLPAVLALSERDDLPEAARGSLRRAIAALPRPGRRARVA
ncbi:MAG: efflux RND transporter permease subunit [Solirubrobacteraceae bacterium]